MAGRTVTSGTGKLHIYTCTGTYKLEHGDDISQKFFGPKEYFITSEI